MRLAISWNSDCSDEIGGDINKCDFFSIFYNKMCQHLEDLPQSDKQYFPDTKCYKITHE